MRTKSSFRRALLIGALGFTLSCLGQDAKSAHQAPSISELRSDAPSHPELLGQLLLSELFAPGGDATRALSTRRALDAAKQSGMLDHLSRALDDTLHGRLAEASEWYLKTAQAARVSADPDADLIAWFACEQAVALAENTVGLFQRWRVWVEASISDPQHLGWRARDELVGWWTAEAWSAAQKDVEQVHAEKSGCLREVRLAGPFGVNAAADSLRSFPPEQGSSWPTTWPEDPWSGTEAHIVGSTQRGCNVSAAETTKSGVYYAEGYFKVAQQTEAIITAGNALQVWVDGVSVLERNIQTWSAWTNVGAGIVLPAGPHRVVAKLTGAETSLRVLARDGRPLQRTSIGPADYTQALAPVAPAFVADALRRYITSQGVSNPPSIWVRYIGAVLAHIEHETEAGLLLFEPLLGKTDATGPALSTMALLGSGDPLYPEEQTQDRVRDFHARALARDPQLWESHLNRISLLAKNSGMVEAVQQLRPLTERFPGVPALLAALTNAYEELGWAPEHAAAVKRMAQLFPESPTALVGVADLYSRTGERAAELATLERIRKLDPDNDIFVTRALDRKDFPTAVQELNTLRARRPQNQALTAKLDELKIANASPVDSVALLKRLVKQAPKDGKARLAVADAEFAGGRADALPQALADAVKDGATLGPLKSAIDLVENMTELERFRLNTSEVIQAFEQSGQQLNGNAARILDYLAVWVHADGSSRMLEHEIVKIQSEEAIQQFAEQEFGDELILKARVIKQDGRILEPQMVRGKPTATFPHLQVGDYVETERLIFKRAEAGGSAFEGPHWFFREKDVAYARSELLIVVPRDRSLDIDLTGGAPEPDVHEEGYFKVYHWRVDGSPAAPAEPLSVPAQEYLPQVTASWGLTLARRLHMLSSTTAELTPIDPRIVRIAAGIDGVRQAKTELDRAKALYRWVLSEVREGEESDGRRAIIGRSGNRWRAFTTLCRAVHVPYRWGVARSRLSPEPTGSAQAAAQFAQTVIRVGSGPYAWLDLNDKYAPFGYLPAGNRGVEAYLFDLNGSSKETTPSDGKRDELRFDAQIALDVTGTADVLLAQDFAGKYGSMLRKGLNEIESKRVREVVETRVLGSSLRGAQLITYSIDELKNLDQALRIKMTATVPHFAVRQQNRLIISPPFSPRLAQFAALPTRQTPMLLATDQDLTVSLKIKLPPGATVSGLEKHQHSHDGFSVNVNDRIEGNTLYLSRVVRLPAGRVAPASYPEFQRFMRAADAALSRDITVTLP